MGGGEKDEKQRNVEMKMKAGNGYTLFISTPFLWWCSTYGVILVTVASKSLHMVAKSGILLARNKASGCFFSFSCLAVNRDSGYELISTASQVTQISTYTCDTSHYLN